jgi:hypothetical protein
MKILVWGASVLGLVALGAPRAQAQAGCVSASTAVTAIRLGGVRNATVNFSGGPNYAPGSFDAVPLLTTMVTVGGSAPGCLVATLSTLPQPADNAIVFQVRVDGVPMEGHHPNLFGFGTPAVSDPNQVDVFYDANRMASYTFFRRVTPGPHRVDVLFAGCCSAGTGIGAGVVEAATLVVEHP